MRKPRMVIHFTASMLVISGVVILGNSANDKELLADMIKRMLGMRED